jgi:hypothetical protein
MCRKPNPIVFAFVRWASAVLQGLNLNPGPGGLGGLRQPNQQAAQDFLARFAAHNNGLQ